MGLSGGPPLPVTASRPYLPYPQVMPTTTPQARPWTDMYPQMPVPVPVPVPLQSHHVGTLPVQPMPAFGPLSSAATPENELGQGQSSLALESGTQPHSIYPLQHHPVLPMGPFSGPLATPLQTTPGPPVRRPSYHPLSGVPSRTSRTPLSPPYGPLLHYNDPSGVPPHTHRRSGHSRARRSVGTRLAVLDTNRETEENSTHDASSHRSDRVGNHGSADTAAGPSAQQVQATSDGLSEKAVAKIARCVLQRVNIEDLPKSERSCVICYNDYGVRTPEGINEQPLRLPKCKHVFGDHCITRWLEESDNCPYCRDKVELQPKHCADRGANHLFEALLIIYYRASEEMYMRIVSNLVHSEEYGEHREPLGSERRSYHANGDSDSSSHDGEAATSVPPRMATTTSPIRNPQRDNARYSQWLPRATPQRGAHPPLSQEREAPRHRRYRLSRGNNPSVATNADGDAADAVTSPLQTQRPDEPAQASTSIPSANSEDGERLPESTAVQVQHQATNTSVASTVQNRIRPW
ncbi:hypothetical protein V8C42DRAFT_352854 [Trichoderma barbatum]